MKEIWREQYHEQNFDRELPIEDLKCYGCKNPFGFEEVVVMINNDPYCDESCFMILQSVEHWNTIQAKTAEDFVREKWDKLSAKEKKAIMWFAELYEIEINT